MRRHLSMLLMSAIAALLAGGALLGFAQNEGTTTSPMDHLHHSHSAEFAKVPETGALQNESARQRSGRTSSGQKALRTTLRGMPRRHR